MAYPNYRALETMAERKRHNTQNHSEAAPPESANDLHVAAFHAYCGMWSQMGAQLWGWNWGTYRRNPTIPVLFGSEEHLPPSKA